MPSRIARSTTLFFVTLSLLLITAAARHLPEDEKGMNPQPEIDSAALRERLEVHVRKLAGEIGERNLWRPRELERASAYIEETFTGYGFEVESQEIRVRGATAKNLEVEIGGASRHEEIIVIGAHYDSVLGSPGANDNASGVAALLEIARLLSGSRPEKTVRLVAFANEEPPLYRTEYMGSLAYARRAKKAEEKIVAMIALETIGYYTEAEDSQAFPLPAMSFFYPSVGNFIAFVSNFSSRSLLRRCLDTFRNRSDFPAEGLVAPGWVTGVDWSDHWSFWQEDYQAIMVTDTALFRYPRYHSAEDSPGELDYAAMSRVTAGLLEVVKELAEGN